ncbi:MAG: deaminase [Candidatus Paceibacterota bacterium]|jgi:deoxycytidylate deaminase
MTKLIRYPYLPFDRKIKYVSQNDYYMQQAKNVANAQSLDRDMPTGCVIVSDTRIIGVGANGSEYHEKHGCERKQLGIPTGQGYGICEGCHPKNHAEQKAIADAFRNYKKKVHDADLYLWGHWWCCESCWHAMIKAGIKNVYLMHNSEVLFNITNPENIIGKEFSR